MKYCAIPMLGVLMLAQGCGSDAVRRTTYETLQNIRAGQCARDLATPCGERESYDEYQRRRQASQPSGESADTTGK